MMKILSLVLVVALCGLSPTPATAHDHHADLSRPAVIGDSLLAGFHDSLLLASQQLHGFAGVELPLPLIGDPGTDVRQIMNEDPLVPPGVEQSARALSASATTEKSGPHD